MEAAVPSLRRAGLKDVEAVVNLARSTFAAAYPELEADELDRYYREVLSVHRFGKVLGDPSSLVLLASAGVKHQAGYLQMEPRVNPGEPVSGNPVELVRLYLAPAFQGRSLGSRLLAEGLQWAVSQGHDGCWVRAWKENPAALAFYRRHGFEVFGEERYTAGGMDDRVLLMRRELP